MPATNFYVREGALPDLRRMATDGRLYAVLDACDEPTVPPKVTELGPERAVSLFRGAAEHQQWNIAPYLVRVDGDLLDWIVGNLWPKPWGIFVVAESDIKSLRKQLRRFLTVQNPDGEAMYFRYYDPRILGAFLPACNDEEISTFYGPIKAYAIGVEGDAVRFFLKGPA